MPPPSSEGLSKGTATTRTFRFSISLMSRLCSAPIMTTPRFEAKRVTAERMSLLGGRFDDLPVFDGSFGKVAASFNPCMKHMHSPSRMTANMQSRCSHSGVSGTRWTR